MIQAQAWERRRQGANRNMNLQDGGTGIYVSTDFGLEKISH
jgi:hypothetical protein